MAKDERLIPVAGRADLPVQSPDAGTMYSPMYDEDPFATSRSFREYVSVVLKRKWLILTILIASTVLTALYVYRLPSTYQSQTQILIKPPTPKTSDKVVNINFGNDPKYWETQVRLIQNPELMRDVVINLGLYKDPNLLNEKAGPGLLTTVRNMFLGEKPPPATPSLPVVTADNSQTDSESPILSPEEEKRVDIYARALTGGLSVEAVQYTNLVNLKYTSNNPELAVNLVNGVADAFIKRDLKSETQGTKQGGVEIENQLEKIRQEVAGLERDRVAYLQAHNLPLGDKGSDLNASILSALSTQLLAAQDERRRLEYEYNTALRAKAQGSIYVTPKVADNASLQAARQQARDRVLAIDNRSIQLNQKVERIDDEIQKLEGKLSTLLVKYTEEYPEVVQVKNDIDKLKVDRTNSQREVDAKIEKELAKVKSESASLENKTAEEVIGTLGGQYESAKKRESQVSAEYASKEREANVQGQAQIGLTTLNQELDTKRKSLDALLNSQNSIQLATMTDQPNNISVQTPAQKPAALIGPQRTRTVTVAFLVALAAGIGLAFLLDYLDDSIKSSDDIGRHLSLPTLALIPHISLEKNAGGNNRLTPWNGSSSAAMMSLENNRSAFAEAYRHLRTSLLFSSAGKPPQTILVTSSQPSEGKTTTVINTAVTLAQAGADVVVVDCDLRRPRLHHHFQLDNMHGITNYLSGERNIEALLKPLPELPHLKIITSGPIPPNPAELLSSNDMRDLLAFLRSNFKHVIVDSPPALSFTDASILSTLVDGVIIVAMTGKSSINLTRRFKKRLQDIGARIYGVVLTGLKRHSVDYGYGYGYGYNYYYTYGEGTPEVKEKAETEK